MDERIERALEHGGMIDITTKGRRTGEPRRIEIVFHNIGGRIYISGSPGRPRAWLANLEADPSFTFHLKDGVKADMPATARIIDDEAERRQVLPAIARLWNNPLELMVESSPLIEVTLERAAEATA